MQLTLVGSTTLVTEECCNCHMVFAMPQQFYNQCRDDAGISFFCPRGHAQHYTTSRIKELEASLERERQWRQQAEASHREAVAERDHHWTERKKLKTRHKHLRQRVKHGVCPCCHRTVSQLARHMETKHPGFVAVE